MRAIAAYPGSVMSQSFGIPEILVSGNNAQILQASRNYEAARAARMTVFASAGDFGATNGNLPAANASFPASHPLVTGVGGTQGHPYPGGLSTGSSFTYGAEEVWNEPAFGVAGGGAPSAFFATPSFQGGLGLTSRTVPDVAYNAAVNGGVLVTYGGACCFIVGGTSAGSPQWAGIAALANQANGGPLGYINSALYKLAGTSALHDITFGNNQLAGTSIGFSAGTGYDFATGLGTPDVAKLVPALVAAAH